MKTIPEVPRILFEDRALLGLYKPAGLDVFGASRGRSRSLWSWLKSVRPGLDGVGDARQPAIAHRLDRYTSGLMLAATDDAAYRMLRQAFSRHEISKEYLALVEGELFAPMETDLPIGSRYRRSRLSSVALPGRRLRSVRPAHTAVWPLAGALGFTLCRVKIKSGVRHQIRVHLSQLGFPVAGDRDYQASQPLDRLGLRFFLHAWKLELGERRYRCDPGADLVEVLADLGINDLGFLGA